MVVKNEKIQKQKKKNRPRELRERLLSNIKSDEVRNKIIDKMLSYGDIENNIMSRYANQLKEIDKYDTQDDSDLE